MTDEVEDLNVEGNNVSKSSTPESKPNQENPSTNSPASSKEVSSPGMKTLQNKDAKKLPQKPRTPQESVSSKEVKPNLEKRKVESAPEIEKSEHTVQEPSPLPEKSENTVLIEPVLKEDKTPLTPKFGKQSKSPLEVIHSIGDLHGWAPGLITYLIKNKLATIEIDGYPLQDKNGVLDEEKLDLIFPNPIQRLKNKRPSPAGLAEQPNFDDTGINEGGHGAIKARWVADSNVGLIQIGDVYDRADHSELAAEILRQLMIDAPGRVFVMVGNHEQFMLENDYKNWYFNEARNAFTDREVNPPRDTTNHFRFLPRWDGKTETDRANATFERYVNSTWTLFLTQGAVLEKLGWIQTEINLSPMLEEGWAGYTESQKILDKYGETLLQKEIPGALTALVIGDTLFHHAEPAAHSPKDGQGLNIPLSKSMTQANSEYNNILLKMYSSGKGSLKNSPDAPLLWARGSSSGAATGNPASESHLEELTRSWQGLQRIVHGHTPTVGSGDFDSVTSGKSTTVSYLGESLGRQSSKGRANRIRIYNIDEGMSPVYYNGDESPYSPLRMPTGLRLEKDEFSMLESKSVESNHLKLDSSNSIQIDVRELWRWSPGEWRSNSQTSWASCGSFWTTQQIHHGKWHGFIGTDTESGKDNRFLLTKQLANTTLLKYMTHLMLDRFFDQGKSFQVQQPNPVILERQPTVGPLLVAGKIKKAWNAIDSILFLMRKDSNSGYTVICLNSTNKEKELIVQAINGKKRLKIQSQTIKQNSVSMFSISNCERILIGKGEEDLTECLDEWSGADSTRTSDIGPVVAYYSKTKKPSNKLEIKLEKEISLISLRNTTPEKKKVQQTRSAKKKQNSHKSWTSSIRLGIPKSLVSQSSENKKSHLAATTLKSQSSEENSKGRVVQTSQKQEKSSTSPPQVKPSNTTPLKGLREQAVVSEFQTSSPKKAKPSTPKKAKPSTPKKAKLSTPKKATMESNVKYGLILDSFIHRGVFHNLTEFVDEIGLYNLKIKLAKKPSRHNPRFDSTYTGEIIFVESGNPSPQATFTFTLKIEKKNEEKNLPDKVLTLRENGFVYLPIATATQKKDTQEVLQNLILYLVDQIVE